MSYRQIGPKERSAIVRLRARGLNVSEISAKTGVSRRAVNRILDASAAPGVMSPKSKRAAQVKRAVLMTAEGFEPKSVAGELGVSLSTVYAWLKEAGVRPVARFEAELARERAVVRALEMKRDDASYREISEALGVEKAWVRNALARANRHGVRSRQVEAVAGMP